MPLVIPSVDLKSGKEIIFTNNIPENKAIEKAMKDNKPYIAFTNRVSAEIYKWTGLL